MKAHLRLPDRLPAGRPLREGEVMTSFASQYLRPADVPLAFHRESVSSSSVLRTHHEMAMRLEAYGRMLQYQFEDGTVLAGNQVLYHPYSRLVPRHLLPLSVNVTSQLQGGVPFALESGSPGGTRASWQVQAEQVIISTLLASMRVKRAAQAEDENDYVRLYFTLDDQWTEEREALRLDAVEILEESWGPWRLTTALPSPVSGVHYGRARLELEPTELGALNGLGRAFIIDSGKNKIVFHVFNEQLRRLQAHAGRPNPEPPAANPEHGADQPALETGISLHLSGHSNIQATSQEIAEILSGEGKRLPVFPGSQTVPKEKVVPRLAITSDGSVRFTTRFQSLQGSWEAHGLPQSMSYLLLNLQLGLSATTGYATSQLAHSRRGMKRDRDMKVLRHLGYSMLIFYEAANFALGLPLSDGTKCESEREVCQSIFTRLGALILKAEGWPVQTGSLEELCSKNVTTLIEGFVSQVATDLRGRDIHVYMPEGELKIQGLSRAVVLFFHALISDLASATTDACFGRARTKYFENFMNGRPTPEREDLAIRTETDAATSARFVYQPGIGERYILPDTSVPPKGTGLLGLMQEGFELILDGKSIEEFDADDFRPEFTLREETDPDSPVIALGARKIDWFELHPKFFFKGVEISTDQASRLSKEGMIEFQGKLYRVRDRDLPSFKRLSQFWRNIQGQGAGLIRAKRRSTEETYFQLPRSQTLELLALRASGVSVRGGERWQEVCRFYDSLNESRPPLELPESFKAKLQSYQETGVQWIRDLYNLGLGGILADDMGLGKTVTSLAFLESLRAEGKMGPCLILVPTSLTFNWLSEGERFAPQLPINIFNSKLPEESALDFVQARPDGAAVICTYGLLQEHSELLQQVEWNCIIFDEAQNLKNITTKRTTAARKLRGSFKLCLTGTPLENHYGEFYSLFDLIVPGSLGDLSAFRERFVNPPRVLREDLDFLRLKARPLMLRRTKDQVMHELPPKVETTIKLPFEEDQKRIYRDIASSYNEQIRTAIAQQGEAKTQLQMLTALLRLRQACSDPAAIPGVQYSGEPPKVSTLLEALQEVTDGGASALVFTQFLATYDRIKNALKEAKIPHYDINGADSRLNRERKLRAFQEEQGGAVMLMTLKTGGVGLNLTKASYIFHIEPWWNPAVENQATDRAHRMGQTNTVQVYRYLIRESVEEKIEILKELKSRRFDALFSVSEDEHELGPGGSALTQADFEYLLS